MTHRGCFCLINWLFICWIKHGRKHSRIMQHDRQSTALHLCARLTEERTGVLGGGWMPSTNRCGSMLTWTIRIRIRNLMRGNKNQWGFECWVETQIVQMYLCCIDAKHQRPRSKHLKQMSFRLASFHLDARRALRKREKKENLFYKKQPAKAHQGGENDKVRE